MILQQLAPFVLLALLAITPAAQGACTPTATPNQQSCSFHLSWNWDLWTHCANETETCNLPPLTDPALRWLVRYGANGAYATADAMTSIFCDNSVFGDPLVGQPKSCDYGGVSADAFVLQRQTNGGPWTQLPQIPGTARTVDDNSIVDSGGVNYCYQIFASHGDPVLSPPSNVACIQSPIIDLVTMKTQAIVLQSRRSTNTSTVISILVNQNTVIGAGGLELTYPPQYTLLVSRRAQNTSTVISILINKSTTLTINP
jgi:hypothetical protein